MLFTLLLLLLLLPSEEADEEEEEEDESAAGEAGVGGAFSAFPFEEDELGAASALGSSLGLIIAVSEADDWSAEKKARFCIIIMLAPPPLAAAAAAAPDGWKKNCLVVVFAKACGTTPRLATGTTIIEKPLASITVFLLIILGNNNARTDEKQRWPLCWNGKASSRLFRPRIPLARTFY